jgi:hypothetical protein
VSQVGGLHLGIGGAPPGRNRQISSFACWPDVGEVIVWPWTKRTEQVGEWSRMPTAGAWSILVAPGFRTINNGDSWQAYSGSRVVYVSSLAVEAPDGSKTSTEAIRVAATKGFVLPAADRLVREEQALCGEAEIVRDGAVLRLKGFICVDGSVATCVIDYTDEQDKDWAIRTWGSLEHV